MVKCKCGNEMKKMYPDSDNYYELRIFVCESCGDIRDLKPHEIIWEFSKKYKLFPLLISLRFVDLLTTYLGILFDPNFYEINIFMRYLIDDFGFLNASFINMIISTIIIFVVLSLYIVSKGKRKLGIRTFILTFIVAHIVIIVNNLLVVLI